MGQFLHQLDPEIRKKHNMRMLQLKTIYKMFYHAQQNMPS